MNKINIKHIKKLKNIKCINDTQRIKQKWGSMQLQ